MDFSVMFQQLCKGSLVTMQLFIIVLPLSLILGILVMLGVRCSIKPVRWLFEFYIYILRGTPLLLQMLILFYGLYYIPGIGPHLVITSRSFACTLAFTLNYAAYFAEIFRGGLLAVDPGQYEASKVLGLSKSQMYLHVVFPQMFRVALPSTANETITLVKDTSLIFALGIEELLQNATNIVNSQATFVPYVFAAIFYLVLTTIPSVIFKKLEKKFDF
jgi:polar amino acid transport system permease protein